MVEKLVPSKTLQFFGYACFVIQLRNLGKLSIKVKCLHNFTKFKDNLFDESHKHEQLLNRLCKYTLGIPKKSSNIEVKVELGIYHLNIEISVKIIKVFFHLMNIIKGGIN